MTKKDEFEKLYPYAKEKIDSDPQLSEPQRQQFYLHLDKCSDGTDIGNCADKFFDLNKFKGEIVPLRASAYKMS